MNSQSFPDESSEKQLIPDFQNNLPTNNKPIPILRLIVPLLIQAGFILEIPAQPVYTYLTGRTVILQTVPVDPYNI